jgi:hypothetical protein
MAGIDAFELNVSCPNVKAGGLEFGADQQALAALVAAARAKTARPIFVKLSPTLGAGIADTLAGSLRGGTVTVQLADGVHINAVSGSISLRDNAIVRSAAFGVLVNAGAVTLERNRGADNRFGVGVYGGAMVMGVVSPGSCHYMAATMRR